MVIVYAGRLSFIAVQETAASGPLGEFNALSPRQLGEHPHWNWWFSLKLLNNYLAIDIPLWVFMALLGTPTACLWRLDRRRPPEVCAKCGYDLTGNTIGVCPECGATGEVR
jgi:hypothetical protein